MSYSFPILPVQEILACLAELEIPFTEQDMIKPTPDTARQVYEQLVQLLVGITREELQQPALSALDVLEFPELHEESIASLAFTRALTDLVTKAGVHDFSLRDLYHPDAKTVRRTLSAVINFAKFREEKVQSYEDLREESEATLERQAALEQQHVQLTRELHQLRDVRQAEMPEIAGMEAEAQELAGKIATLNKQQAALHGEVKALKAEGNELADKAANEKFALATAQQEQKSLKSQIVHSPARLQRSLQDLTNQIEHDKSATLDAERRARDVQVRLDLLAKVEKDVQKIIRLMEEAEAEISKHKEASRQLKSTKAEIQANEETRWRLDTETQHFKRQEQVVKERIQRLDEQGDLKKEAATAAVVARREEKCAIQSHNAATQAKIAEYEHQIQTMLRQMDENDATHGQEMKMVSHRYGELQTQLRDYHRELMATIAQDSTDVAEILA